MQVLSEGQCIKHEQYGFGIVAESDVERTTIDFDSVGLKKFVTSLMTHGTGRRSSRTTHETPPPQQEGGRHGSRSRGRWRQLDRVRTKHPSPRISLTHGDRCVLPHERRRLELLAATASLDLSMWKSLRGAFTSVPGLVAPTEAGCRSSADKLPSCRSDRTSLPPKSPSRRHATSSLVPIFPADVPRVESSRPFSAVVQKSNEPLTAATSLSLLSVSFRSLMSGAVMPEMRAQILLLNCATCKISCPKVLVSGSGPVTVFVRGHRFGSPRPVIVRIVRLAA